MYCKICSSSSTTTRTPSPLTGSPLGDSFYPISRPSPRAFVTAAAAQRSASLAASFVLLQRRCGGARSPLQQQLDSTPRALLPQQRDVALAEAATARRWTRGGALLADILACDAAGSGSDWGAWRVDGGRSALCAKCAEFVRGGVNSALAWAAQETRLYARALESRAGSPSRSMMHSAVAERVATPSPTTPRSADEPDNALDWAFLADDDDDDESPMPLARAAAGVAQRRGGSGGGNGNGDDDGALELELYGADGTAARLAAIRQRREEVERAERRRVDALRCEVARARAALWRLHSSTARAAAVLRNERDRAVLRIQRLQRARRRRSR